MDQSTLSCVNPAWLPCMILRQFLTASIVVVYISTQFFYSNRHIFEPTKQLDIRRCHVSSPPWRPRALANIIGVDKESASGLLKPEYRPGRSAGCNARCNWAALIKCHIAILVGLMSWLSYCDPRMSK